MLDIRQIRSDPEAVVAALSRRGPQAAEAVGELLELDERWRGLTTQLRGAWPRATRRAGTALVTAADAARTSLGR